jgi:hypothetical protein
MQRRASAFSISGVPLCSSTSKQRNHNIVESGYINPYDGPNRTILVNLNRSSAEILAGSDIWLCECGLRPIVPSAIRRMVDCRGICWLLWGRGEESAMSLQEIQVSGASRRLCAGFDIQLLEDVLQMRLHGAHGDIEFAADFAIGSAISDKPQDL